LVGRVVRDREVDRLFAGRRDRDLVEIEVEVLGARRVGGVERLHRPLDLRFRVAELLADRVGDGALEAFAVFRFIVFEVRRGGRFVGGDGGLARGGRLHLRGRAVGGRRVGSFAFAGARRGARLLAATAGQQGQPEGQDGNDGKGGSTDRNPRAGDPRPEAQPPIRNAVVAPVRSRRSTVPILRPQAAERLPRGADRPADRARQRPPVDRRARPGGRAVAPPQRGLPGRRLRPRRLQGLQPVAAALRTGVEWHSGGYGDRRLRAEVPGRPPPAV